MNKKLRKRIKRYAAEVLEDITDCGCQQPVAEGEIMWLRSQPTELDSVMGQHGVPDELLDAVALLIQCPACGEQLNRYSDVGIEWASEVHHRKQIETANEQYLGSLLDFRKHLFGHQRLRGLHPVGRDLLRGITLFPRGAIINREWVRARRYSGKPFTPDDLRPPPPEISRAGRYNHQNQSHWYLAETEEQAASEVAKEGDEYVWTQRFKVTRLDDVLDVRAWVPDDGMAQEGDPEYEYVSLLAFAAIYGDHLTRMEEPEADDREPFYAIPRYVSDVAKRRGFTGIRYRSPRHVGENLVIFDGRMPLEAIGEPNKAKLTSRFFRRRASRFLFEGFHIGMPEWPPSDDDEGLTAP